MITTTTTTTNDNNDNDNNNKQMIILIIMIIPKVWHFRDRDDEEYRADTGVGGILAAYCVAPYMYTCIHIYIYIYMYR